MSDMDSSNGGSDDDYADTPQHSMQEARTVRSTRTKVNYANYKTRDYDDSNDEEDDGGQNHGYQPKSEKRGRRKKKRDDDDDDEDEEEGKFFCVFKDLLKK
jgi:hypothetical protein